MLNQIKFDPDREQREHSEYLNQLAQTQDLVQESVDESTNSLQPPNVNDSDVQDALNTVKAILAQQGVEINAGNDAQALEGLLAQAQSVDENLKDKDQKQAPPNTLATPQK